MTLADRLRQAMSDAGMSQKQLADAVGVKPPSVNGWLSSKSKFLRGENLLRAARALHVSETWLATGKGSKTPTAGAVPSQPPRIDLDTLQAAIDLIREVAKITRAPLDKAFNALALAVAVEIVEEAETEIDDANVIDFMQKFAARLEQREKERHGHK